MHFAGYQNELSDALRSMNTSTISFQQLIQYIDVQCFME